MKIINITKPSLPPFDEFTPVLREIWNSGILTNNGKYHQLFEKELAKFLGVNFISLCNNATSALLLALKVLDIKGEVITTPFTFVATTHALTWNSLIPVFCDIKKDSYNIDPSKIEKLINSKTSAILPVHCYGYPCDVEIINEIAIKYKLKVIYDAAHAFGVKYKDSSILNYGDLSILSFHATKVFNTFEGGAIICKDIETKIKIDNLKNFGFIDETSVNSIGINAKMSEFNAALGCIQLKKFDQVIETRKKIYELYVNELKDTRGIQIIMPDNMNTHNFSYFPIQINDSFDLTRDDLYLKFKNNNINVRRYFYPLITEFNVYKNSYDASYDTLINSKYMANRVLCLPIFPGLTNDEVHYICNIINN